MAVFDGTKDYLDQKSIIEKVGNTAVDFSNICDLVYARAGLIGSRVGGKTVAQLVSLGVPQEIAEDVVKVADAAGRIRTAIADEVSAGNLRSGQFRLE